MTADSDAKQRAGARKGESLAPLLANVFLHYVLDVWFHKEVLPRLTGAERLIRFADDFVVITKVRSDAEPIMGDRRISA